jgi:hypothetical protein
MVTAACRLLLRVTSGILRGVLRASPQNLTKLMKLNMADKPHSAYGNVEVFLICLMKIL